MPATLAQPAPLRDKKLPTCARRAPRQPKPAADTAPVTRSCKWVYDAATTLRLLEDAIPAPLTVTVGGSQWTYLVTLLDDGTYALAHVAADNSGTEVYQVDLYRRGCTCPAFRYRHAGKTCKHCDALRAAMAWLEAQR